MKRLALWLLPAALALLWAANLPWRRIAEGGNDFRPFYAGANLAFSSGLYDAAAHARFQAEHFGSVVPAWQFVRPPFYAVMLRPLAVLPYGPAYWLWQALMLAAFSAFVLKFRGVAPELPWLAAVSIPYLALLTNGQDASLWLLCAAGGVAALGAGRDGLAGLLLACCAVKFHFFAFVPLALLRERRWKALGWGCAALGGLYLAGAWAQGLGWPLNYARWLASAPVSPEPYTLPNLRGFVLATGLSSQEWPLAALVAVLAVAAVVLPKLTIEGRCAAALLGGFLLSRHAYVADALLLMAAYVFLPERSVAKRIVFALLLPPVYFLLFADGAWGAVYAVALGGALVALLAAGRGANQGSAASASGVNAPTGPLTSSR